MLVRLLAASIIIGAIVVMSPVRQGPSLPVLPDGASTLAAGLVRDGLMGALDPAGPAAPREAEPMRAAVATAIVRGMAEHGERARRMLGGAAKLEARPEIKHAASSDTLQAADRMPGWRGSVAGP
jgi:hypothetical protein